MCRLLCAFGLVTVLTFSGCGGKSEPPAAGPADGGAAPATTGGSAPGATDVDLGAPMPPTTTEATTTPAGALPTPPTTSLPVVPPPAPTAPVASAAVPAGSDLSLISETSAAVILLRPSQAFNNPLVQGILQEMEQIDSEFNLAAKLAEMREQAGVDVGQVEQVLVVVDKQHLEMLPFMAAMLLGGMMGPPMLEEGVEFAVPAEASPDNNCFDDPATAPGDAGVEFSFGEPPPPLTVLVKFTQPVDAEKFLTAGGSDLPEEKTHAGQKYYVKPDGSAIWFRDAVTAVIVPESKIEAVMAGTPQPGPLAATVQPLTDHDFALVLDVRSLHEFISQMAQENPAMAVAGGLVKQVNTFTLAVDLRGEKLLQVQLHTINEGSAGGLQQMLSTFLEQGQAEFARKAESGEFERELKELLPLVREMVDGTTMTADGAVCSLTVPRPSGLEKFPGLIRPVLLEAQRQAAAAKEMNNLKMIGLAFHNYHDVYGAFPWHGGPGSADAPGKGLSWRVHLLPFLEEGFELYGEFNLKEPWDSEHNKALIPRMPKSFGDNPEGKSSLHVFVGEGTPFGQERGVTIPSFLDGTSNTIMVVEAGPDTADIWTKPGGLTLNPDNPVAALGNIGETFLVLLADGSVHRLQKSIDAATLRNLIQHQDGNPVRIPD
jgi:hypothetical protein